MRFFLVATAFLLIGSTPVFSQEDSAAGTEKTALAGFEWLKQMEGSWDTEFNGTMKCQVVGTIWVVNELSFQSGPSAVQTIGYDAEKKQFIGSWIDSTSTFMWHYTGSLDETGKVLTLETNGPDMSDPKKTRQYRDTYEFTSENEIAARSQQLDDKGEWQTVNTGKMTRKAK